MLAHTLIGLSDYRNNDRGSDEEARRKREDGVLLHVDVIMMLRKMSMGRLGSAAGCCDSPKEVLSTSILHPWVYIMKVR